MWLPLKPRTILTPFTLAVNDDTSRYMARSLSVSIDSYDISRLHASTKLEHPSYDSCMLGWDFSRALLRVEMGWLHVETNMLVGSHI